MFTVARMLKNLKTILELIKINFLLSWSHTKVFIHSFLAYVPPVILEFLAFLFSLFLSKSIGLLDVVGVSIGEMILSYLIFKILISITSIAYWKSEISDMMEYGELIQYLIRPKHPLLLDSLLSEGGYWLQHLLLHILLFVINLIYYKIIFVNLLKSLFVFLISLIFVYSTTIFLRSLDFLIKGLASLSDVLKYSLSGHLLAYPPRYYEKLNKILFYSMFLFSAYFVSFFTVVPTLVKGEIYYFHLAAYTIFSIIMLSVSKKLWDFGIKKHESYL